MAKSSFRSLRKASGGRYHSHRSKRKFALSSQPTFTKLGKRNTRKARTLGGHQKTALFSVEEANVSDKKGKITKVKIKTVLENAANIQLVRRNILTKGAVIETELGKARITNRPGQEGCINAVLI